MQIQISPPKVKFNKEITRELVGNYVYENSYEDVKEFIINQLTNELTNQGRLSTLILEIDQKLKPFISETKEEIDYHNKFQTFKNIEQPTVFRKIALSHIKKTQRKKRAEMGKKLL